MFCRSYYRDRNSPELPIIEDPDPQEDAAMDIFRGLNRLRKEGTFCDITLRVGAKTIRAHKIVITLNSPYFMAMFSGHFSESDQQEITIKEVDADCLELLIDYMYTANLKIDSDNVKRLIVTASFLQVSKVHELCCDFIKGELNADNCIEYMLFGVSNSIQQLVDMSIETAAHYFARVFSQNEYLEIEHEELMQLTQMVERFSYPADLIFSFVMRWIKHSFEARKHFTGDLLQYLDPILVSPNVMHSSEIVNSENSCIATNPEFTAWAARANATSTSNEPGDHILVSRRLSTFRPLRIKIFSQAKHRQIQELSISITHGSYVCNGYYIYHQGGWRGNTYLLNESYVYHPIRNEWSSFVPLLEARACHRSCVLNGKIFSVGGSDGSKALSSVEFTDIYTGEQGFIDPLPRPKEQTGLGIHENSIYVVGGTDRDMPYKCMHRFDAREGVWQELAPSTYRAGSSSCAVVGESIYTTHLDTLQRYDIRANDWAMISAEDKRYPLEVFAIDNTLFGLFDDHVARFIPESSKWEYQLPLGCHDTYLQVATNLLFPNVNEKDIRDPVFEGCDPETESDNAYEIPIVDDEEMARNNSDSDVDLFDFERNRRLYY